MEIPLDVYTIILPDMLVLAEFMYGGEVTVPLQQLGRVVEPARRPTWPSSPQGSKSRSDDVQLQQDLASAQLDDDDGGNITVFQTDDGERSIVRDEGIPDSGSVSASETVPPLDAAVADDHQKHVVHEEYIANQEHVASQELVASQDHVVNQEHDEKHVANQEDVAHQKHVANQEVVANMEQVVNQEHVANQEHDKKHVANQEDVANQEHVAHQKHVVHEEHVANQEHVPHQHHQDEDVDIDVVGIDQEIDPGMELDGQSHSEASMVGDGVVVGQDQNHPLSRRSTRLATTLRKLAATLRDLATTPRKKLAATPRKLSATLGKFAETPRKKFAETRRKKLAAIPQNFTATRILRSHNKSGNVSSTGEPFVSNWNLVAHTHTHTGERLFGCFFCDASFRQKAHLEKHTTAVHLPREEESESPKIKRKKPVRGK
ncbi:Transcription factor Ken 1 [Folsomia candida]|uniref:Transcription factor Ken 1 n=2 Tax=Folsomia candida TaxID=158441 RepID=A0A226DM69_FOLCA|nr:Transcription factor Ken 1 [Folsomia candida]